MRSTIHVVSRRDYWPLAIAIREERRAWSRRVQGADERGPAARRPNDSRSLPRRTGRGRRRRSRRPASGFPGSVSGPTSCACRPPGPGTRRRADLFGLAEEWVGPEPELSELEAREHLVRRYLGAFGPAPRTDIANWAGMRVGSLAGALEGMELRRFSDEQGHELLDLPRAPLPAAETPVPVRFLPTWDATLLVHARRTGILADEHRTRLFNSSNPQSERTFLVDGQVAGSWRPEDGRVRLEPFGRLEPCVARRARRRKPSG